MYSTVGCDDIDDLKKIENAGFATYIILKSKKCFLKTRIIVFLRGFGVFCFKISKSANMTPILISL